MIGQVEKRIRAKTKGRLYHLANKGYPAMVDGDDTIYGELFGNEGFERDLSYLK